MKKDGRTFGKETQQELRYLVIKLLKRNISYLEVSEITGFHYSTITKLWRIYKTHGKFGLILKKRGVKLGTNSKLNIQQTSVLAKILKNKTPDQMQLSFSLWTRRAVQLLIRKLWSLTLPIRTIGRYLKRLGFTPQKPLQRAFGQNPKAVREWLEETYPKIAERAKKEGAKIHWLDETGLRSNSNYIRGYSPKGKTPIIYMKSKRFSINLVSSVTNRGKMRFMTYYDSMNSQKLIIFLSRLCKDVDRKIFVILDNLNVHHSKMISKWLNRKDQIEAFYLPSYSPELNPDERLNRDLKTNFHAGSLAKNELDFRKKTISILKSLQRKPVRVLGYFKSKFVRYAA